MPRLARTMETEGVPFGVIVLYPWRGQEERAMRFLKSLVGKEMTVSELVRELQRFGAVRMNLTFSPDTWYRYDSWTPYAYPWSTIVKEFDDMKVKILPFNPESERVWWERFGFGIVVVTNPIKMSTVPVGFAISELPRKMIAICVMQPDGRWAIYSGDEKLRKELERRGFKVEKIDGFSALVGGKGLSPRQIREFIWSLGARPFVAWNAKPIRVEVRGS